MSSYDRILLCYDATREGRGALRHAAVLAQQLKAETHLLAVLNNSAWIQGSDILSDVPFDAANQSAKEILRDGVEKLAARGVSATGHFAIGNPLELIPSFAEKLKIDLIVLGHRRSGLLARWWAGRNDGLLLDRVSCSVLVTIDTEHDKAEAAAEELRETQQQQGRPEAGKTVP